MSLSRNPGKWVLRNQQLTINKKLFNLVTATANRHNTITVVFSPLLAQVLLIITGIHVSAFALPPAIHGSRCARSTCASCTLPNEHRLCLASLPEPRDSCAHEIGIFHRFRLKCPVFLATVVKARQRRVGVQAERSGSSSVSPKTMT